MRLTEYVDQILSQNKEKIEKEQKIVNLFVAKRRLNEALNCALVDVRKLSKSNEPQAILAEAQFKADHMISTANIDSQIQNITDVNGIDLSDLITKVSKTTVQTAEQAGSFIGSVINTPTRAIFGFGKKLFDAAKA